MRKFLLFTFFLATATLQAQVYPFVDDFESYANFTTLGTQGGYKSDMSVYQTHGMGNSPKGLIAQISNFNTRDTMVSPVIGPLGAAAQFSMYYRIINSSLYPSTATTLGAGDAIEIYAGVEAVGIYQLMYTINSQNHTTDTAFKKIKIAVPAPFIGNSGNFKIVVKRGNTGDYFVDIDSLSLRDTTAITPLVITTGQTECVCYGDCNGTVFVTAAGGNPPYTYQWNTGSNTDTLHNLCADPYRVTVTDANGQSVSALQEVYEPPLIYAAFNNVTSIPCYGGTGCINLRTTTYGGHAPYSYIWSNSAVEDSICGLAAGTYDVTIHDINNCSGTGTFNMFQHDSLQVNYSTTNPTIFGASDGSITASVTGGAGYILISVNGGPFNSDTSFTSVAAGCYSLIVKDNNGCTIGPDTVCLVNPPSGVAVLQNEILSIYPSPAQGFIILKTNGQQGTASLINMLGEVVLSQYITGSETKIETAFLPKGNYVLSFKSDKNTSRKFITLH